MAITYIIDNLEELALMFESRALRARSKGNTAATAKLQAFYTAEENTWIEAAAIVRSTKLVKGADNV